MGSSKTSNSCWLSLEDLDNDLCEFSEIAVSQEDVSEPPLATIVQYRAQMSANHQSSIFDTHMPYENVTYISSGRGRGGFSKFYKPGVPVNDTDEEAMIYRKIREVSGPGYSNIIIENSARAKQSKKSDWNFSDVPSTFEEISTTNGFTERGTASPTSRSSTPSQSKPSEPAPTSAVTVSNEQAVEKPLPPPLSVLLKRAKKKNVAPKEEVQAVAESYAKVAEEPPKKAEEPKIPRKTEERKERPAMFAGSRIEAESSSESSQFSARNSCSTPSSEASYNTAGSVPDWYSRPAQFESSSSSGEEPLSWRKKTSPGKIYTKEWRKDFSKKDNFNINSTKDFPEL